MSDFVYVEAPNRPDLPANLRKLFVGGAIPGSTDWQALVTRQVQASGLSVAVFNPRRADFPADQPGAVAEQVAWEHEHLHLADVTLFWFPAMPDGMVAPTTLFELGMALGEHRRIVVGASTWYPRRDILEHQLAHHPHVVLHRSLDDTVAAALRLLPGPHSPGRRTDMSETAMRWVKPDPDDINYHSGDGHRYARWGQCVISYDEEREPIPAVYSSGWGGGEIEFGSESTWRLSLDETEAFIQRLQNAVAYERAQGGESR